MVHESRYCVSKCGRLHDQGKTRLLPTGSGVEAGQAAGWAWVGEIEEQGQNNCLREICCRDFVLSTPDRRRLKGVIRLN